MNSFNSRGQEAAPFEVLIAVILMGFVILIGLSAIQHLEQQRCEGELSQSLNELKHSIEVVSAGRSREEVVIQFPSCFPSNRSYLKLEFKDDERQCRVFCEGKRTRCILLRFNVFEKKLSEDSDAAMIASEYSKTICLDSNPITGFTECGNEGDVPEGFVATDMWQTGSGKGIAEGRYLLVNASDYFSAVPKVCVYEFNPSASSNAQETQGD